MSDNVTVRDRGISKYLSFSPKAGGEEAIIGALSDMDLTVPQDEQMLDCEVIDGDLFGMDLMEIENANSSRDVVSKGFTRDSCNISKSLKASKKMGAPLGFHNKKAEVLRRESPRQRSPKLTDRSSTEMLRGKGDIDMDLQRRQ
ncbi:hypothetical protein Bca4012_010514 [Brassica carinata]|uniref:Uncharacterized protein n=1 Tax=Brassica carinata TaxID=52824 RepID=A0A8X7S0M4_BRACI|nr:hypothetical protein Bca52824_035430 [Brassica carinata]